jgi:type I restriction enzyme M protein
VLLFVKYVSDKREADINSLIERSDRRLALMTWSPSRGQGDRRQDQQDHRQARRSKRPQGKVIDQADFNDEEKLGKGKEMQTGSPSWSRSSTGSDLDFRGSRAEGDDLLGDAYEYLMRHFATESGKSKGQFYTPAEVSRILAQVVGARAGTKQDQTVYDPPVAPARCCSRWHDEAPPRLDLTLYGQEKDNATLGPVPDEHDPARQRDRRHLQGQHPGQPRSFNEDRRQLKTFDFAVANPPFSVKSWSNGFGERLRALRVRHDPPRRTATTPSCCTSSSHSRAPARRQ